MKITGIQKMRWLEHINISFFSLRFPDMYSCFSFAFFNDCWASFENTKARFLKMSRDRSEKIKVSKRHLRH